MWFIILYEIYGDKFNFMKILQWKILRTTEIYSSRIYKSKGNRSTGTLVWSHAPHWTGVAATLGHHRASSPTFKCMCNTIWKTKPRNPREILAFVLQSLKHSRCLHSFEIYAIERKPKPAPPTGRIRADVVGCCWLVFQRPYPPIVRYENNNNDAVYATLLCWYGNTQ